MTVVRKVFNLAITHKSKSDLSALWAGRQKPPTLTGTMHSWAFGPRSIQSAPCHSTHQMATLPGARPRRFAEPRPTAWVSESHPPLEPKARTFVCLGGQEIEVDERSNGVGAGRQMDGPLALRLWLTVNPARWAGLGKRMALWAGPCSATCV